VKEQKRYIKAKVALVDVLVDFQGREVTKPGDDHTQIRLLALTTYIPSYAEINATPKHE
jgi:hypothetical protein